MSGALLGGGLYLVQLLPLPTQVDRYLPLGIAFSVIGIANEPDGALQCGAPPASVSPSSTAGPAPTSPECRRCEWRRAGSCQAVMADTLLAVRDVTVRFGGLVALDHVDLEVAPGSSPGSSGPTGPARRPSSM